MRVLVLEDDVQIRTLVRTGLEQHGISVTEAATVAEAYAALAGTAFEVIVLDLTLPDGSGFDVLRHVNAELPDSHVIVLSGAVTELDRVRGLDLGADDYVVKPFSGRELTARVLAVRRRRDALPVTSIRFGHFELDLAGRRLLRDGVALTLTPMELGLLGFLAARPGHVFSRTDLLSAVWPTDAEPHSTATVTDHVRRLRAKIEADPHRPVLLRTVRGLGYTFHLPTATRAAPAHGRGRVTTVEGRIVDIDAASLELLGGRDASELLGAHVLDFVAPQSLRSARARVREVAAGLDGRSQVLLVVQPDGTEVPVEITTSGTVWRGDEAVELGVRHAADESLHLRHLMTGVLSEVTDAVVVTDMSLHVRSWNGAAERLYGWSEAEVLGRHLLDLIDWTGDRTEFAAVRADLEMADQWHGSITQATRDGSLVHVRASTSVVRDEAGVALGIVSVNRPVVAEEAVPLRSGDAADELRRGLAAGEFEVYYQPVVALDDGHVVTVEALVRWNHPEEGLLGPDAFIGTAEQTDVIHELGTFVLGTACRQVALWRIAGAQVALAVNLSARELADPLLVERITETVAASGLDLDVLWLEVTETALVEDVTQASAVLHELAALGVGISIDDFGTGWASLTYLRRFPVHVLKIDRSFVTGIDHDPNSATIVRSILALGAELDLVVVAEGIETIEEADALRALGCTTGQGYLYGRPVPAVDIDLARMRPALAMAAVPSRPPGDGDRDVGRPGSRSGAATSPGPGPVQRVAPATAGAGADLVAEVEVISAVLRRLLRIRSAAGAAALLQRTVRELGGSLVLATEAGDDALQVDVSLGEGPALLPRAEALSVARMQIERLIPGLTEDARQAVDLLNRQEHLGIHVDTDALTGLANRQVLARVLPRAQRGVIVMLDLDRFGSVNDALGHPAGDRVLVQFGALLRRSVRAGDVCCRIGGEEFVIVASDPDLDVATGMVERIRQAWAESAPHPVTFSAGVASVHETGAGTALLAADRALLRAKELGRDRTELDDGET